MTPLQDVASLLERGVSLRLATGESSYLDQLVGLASPPPAASAAWSLPLKDSLTLVVLDTLLLAAGSFIAVLGNTLRSLSLGWYPLSWAGS